MRLKVISSGSIGNAYIVYNDSETLLIEAGVKFDRIKRSLNFDLSNVVGCLISHAHKDHCIGVKGVTDAGIEIYSQAATIESFGYYSHRHNIFEPGKQIRLGGFLIKAFELQHDVPCLGFYINHIETGNFCFVTDTFYCQYTFPNLNNIIIEANYCSEILEQRRQSGAIIDFLRDRVLRSHMSLQTCKEFLKANDLSKVNNILLIHLSDSNSNAEKFRKEVKEQTVRTVHVAESGLDINFDITPF